ncbi:unnamed protein product [Caretta caretta]
MTQPQRKQMTGLDHQLAQPRQTFCWQLRSLQITLPHQTNAFSFSSLDILCLAPTYHISFNNSSCFVLHISSNEYTLHVDSPVVSQLY